MAADFKISVEKFNDTLHLKLTGDFDEESAQQVQDVLEENCEGVLNVYINTSALKRIEPSGLIAREWPVWEQALKGNEKR